MNNDPRYKRVKRKTAIVMVEKRDATNSFHREVSVMTTMEILKLITLFNKKDSDILEITITRKKTFPTNP